MPASAAGRTAAQYARDSATNPASYGFRVLSAQMCWDAVKLCLFNSGAISQATNDGMRGHTHNYQTFIRTHDPVVADANQMRLVPQGAILGFIDLDHNNILVHAMVATGHGLAAGNKNDCIGLGHSIGWELLDLSKLAWVQGASHFSAPNTSATGGPLRRVEVRVRAI